MNNVDAIFSHKIVFSFLLAIYIPVIIDFGNSLWFLRKWFCCFIFEIAVPIQKYNTKFMLVKTSSGFLVKLNLIRRTSDGNCRFFRSNSLLGWKASVPTIAYQNQSKMVGQFFSITWANHLRNLLRKVCTMFKYSWRSKPNM